VKLRKIILASVAASGLIVLVLGLAGVLSQRQRPLTAVPVESPAAAPAPPGELVVGSFRTQGPDWELTAPEAHVEPERGLRLREPLLRMTRPGTAKEGVIEARADRGSYSEEGQRIHMSGHVHLRLKGAQVAELKTDSLEIDLEAKTARTDAAVELVSQTAEGRHQVTGRGARLSVKDRRLEVLREVRIESVGAVLPSRGEAVQVACAGPCVADGFRRTVTLESEVVLKQAEAELRAGRITAHFGEGSRSPERLTAEGKVSLRSPDLAADGDRLVRFVEEDRLVLEGRPARLRQAVGAVRAAKIELEPRAGNLFVPAAGSLRIARQGQGNYDVRWDRSMRFLRSTRRAVFQGKVRFTSDGARVECGELSIAFDQAGRQISEVQAREGVRLEGLPGPDLQPDKDQVEARCREMTYRPEDGILVLLGEAELRHAGRSMKADRIEWSQAKDRILAAGPGTMETGAGLGASPEPLKATWGESMEYDLRAGTARFDGEVSLRYGRTRLAAERVEISQQEATMRVAGPGSLEVPGGGEAEGEPIRVTWSGGMRYDGGEGVAHCERQVSVTLGDRVLSADSVSARRGTDGRLVGLDAEGDVVLKEAGRVARGDRLSWDVEQDLAVLTGAPAVLREGPQRLYGERIELRRKAGQVRITGRRRVEAALRSSRRLESVVGF